MMKPLHLLAAAALAVAPAPRAALAQAAAPADVAFMRDMIGHHAQAVEMVALLQTRTQRDDMRLLGERIDVSQRDEMASMRRWLVRHGITPPDTGMAMHHGAGSAAMHDEHAMATGASMPGMLTPAEMARLAATRGPAFDRLFLQGMIRHHEGALTMVRALFAKSGAAQDSEVYTFASDVDADQRAEIARMQALLRTLPPAPSSTP